MQEFFIELLKELKYETIRHEVEYQTRGSILFTLLDDDVELAAVQVERIVEATALEHDIDIDSLQMNIVGSESIEIVFPDIDEFEDVDVEDVL